MSVSTSDKIELIGANALFSGLENGHLSTIAESFRPIAFTKDREIFCENDDSNALYIVVEGEAVVRKNVGLGHRELRRVYRGECFGELSLIASSKRSASVQAVTDMTCLEMKATDFEGFLDEIPHLGRNAMHTLAQRVRDSEALAGEHIVDAYNTLMFSLASLAESRDNETGAHIRRVRDFCQALAAKLIDHPRFRDEITEHFVENIYVVSPLHDIGKVGIRDSILLKPGKLTDEEMAIMRTHTTLGAETLKKVLAICPHPTFQMAYNIVCFHHEHYDGNGYPTGISGEAIPAEARIMALADVYDALRSRRVYKDAYSVDEVRRILSEGSGSQFDPWMTEVMLANMDEFEAMRERYPEV